MSDNSPFFGTHVMVVDDSAVIRGMITRILESHPQIRIVASAPNGQIAVRMYQEHKPDVVIMDIEMPMMDGITALGEIVKFDARARVIMCSTLTRENAEISLKAMALGAVDYIPKPTSASEIHSSAHFKERIIELVRSFGKQGPQPRPAVPTAAAQPASAAPAAAPKPSLLSPTEPLVYKPEPPAGWRPKILAIGSSTGGPQALFEFLKPLKGITSVPIVITQHMPPTFTALLAQHITAQTGISCEEASEGTVLEAGRAYIARGGMHMLLRRNDAGQIVTTINDGPPENFCKPAVDPMLRSLIPLYGRDILVTILTGMGADGMLGCKAVTEAGGYVAAQDQKTSVVWGMPGAVATAGLCSAILPLTELGPWVRKRVAP